MKRIAAAGNTVVPALLTLDKLGFAITVQTETDGDRFHASRGDEEYLADDPVMLLGLVKLIEERGWQWRPSDSEIQTTLERYNLGR